MVKFNELYTFLTTTSGKEPYDPKGHFLHATQLFLAISTNFMKENSQFNTMLDTTCLETEKVQLPYSCPPCAKEEGCYSCIETYDDKTGERQTRKFYYTCITTREFALKYSDGRTGQVSDGGSKKFAVKWWHIVIGLGTIVFCCAGWLCYSCCIEFAEICNHVADWIMCGKLKGIFPCCGRKKKREKGDSEEEVEDQNQNSLRTTHNNPAQQRLLRPASPTPHAPHPTYTQHAPPPSYEETINSSRPPPHLHPTRTSPLL